MEIEKCKWKDGKQTAVMLMIDDYANKYMVDKNKGEYLGSDWGGRCLKKDSFINFLEKRLLKKFPYIKVTLFLVVGSRTDIVNNGKNSYKNSILADDEFIKSLNYLKSESTYEIAYHGYTHGKIINNKFLQEWECFSSLEEAVYTINQGKRDYKMATGENFKGGKYCGYKYNVFSDLSICKTDFIWWCRRYAGDFLNGSHDDTDVTSVEISKFGNVVDIPTTIDGNLFSLKLWKRIFTREYVKALYYKFKKKITLESCLAYLIEHQNIISITEHTSPFREDNQIQYPNVVTDIDNLIWIFNYLKNHDLWYATGSEIAEYYNAAQNVSILLENKKLNVIAEKSLYQNIYLSVELKETNAKKIRLYNKKENIIVQRDKYGKLIANVKAKTSGNIYDIDISLE